MTVIAGPGVWTIRHSDNNPVAWKQNDQQYLPVLWSCARMTMERTPTPCRIRVRWAGRDSRHQARESGRQFWMQRGLGSASHCAAEHVHASPINAWTVLTARGVTRLATQPPRPCSPVPESRGANRAAAAHLWMASQAGKSIKDTKKYFKKMFYMG